MTTEIMETERDDRAIAKAPSTSLEHVKSREKAEIEAAISIARAMPRNEIEFETKMVAACKRPGLATAATFSYPRGKEKISGPTIRLAEELARCWGNMKYGFRELEQSNGVSVVEAFAHDLESNLRIERTIQIHHKIKYSEGRGGGFKQLSDPRDIYEMVANNAQRRVRALILEIIPGDFVSRAVAECRKTLAAGNKEEPLKERIKRMAVLFSAYGITKETLEKKLGHGLEMTVPEEIVDLQEIFNSIKEGHTKPSDWFNVQGPQEGGKAAELSEKLNEATSDDMPNPFEKDDKKGTKE